MEDLAAEERFYCHFLMGEEEEEAFDYFSHLDLLGVESEVAALFGH